MKRTAMNHTKMKKLMRALDVPQYVAVGILESLWHLTAREAMLGNIGKLSNEDIAIAIDWRGNEDVLVNALISTGWLDESEESRLVVHDWMEHADDATKKAIDRLNKKTADNGGQVQTTAEISDEKRLPEPLPLPEPVKEKPSREKRESDSRHTPFRSVLDQAWKSKNPSLPMPWDAGSGKQLSMFLAANPELTEEGFRSLLRNRHKSEVNHSESPKSFLPRLTNFASGPLDRFNIPLTATGGRPQIVVTPQDDVLAQIRERDRKALEEVQRELPNAS